MATPNSHNEQNNFYFVPRLHLAPATPGDGTHLEVSAQVPADPEKAYLLWTEFEALPHFMRGRELALRRDESRSVWIIDWAGKQVPWEAELLEDLPGQKITWRNQQGRMVGNQGSISFVKMSPNFCKIALKVTFESPSALVDPTEIRRLACKLNGALARFGALVTAHALPGQARFGSPV